MSGKTFFDTNIVVYLYSDDEPEKQATAVALIEHPPRQTCQHIEPQVVVYLGKSSETAPLI